MDTFLTLLKHFITETPYMWPSLGFVTAISLFVAPVLYNGDYKGAVKTLITVGGYGFFAGLLIYYQSLEENVGDGEWLQSVIILLLVGLAYILGLFIGVFINRHINGKKSNLKIRQGKTRG